MSPTHLQLLEKQEFLELFEWKQRNTQGTNENPRDRIILGILKNAKIKPR
jgi:hypothetical protein